MANRDQTIPARERANSFPENVIRKVTIQQTVIQPANTSVALTECVDHIRRYPKVEYHDPSNRGHRGKYPVRPTRGAAIKSMKGLELKTEGKNDWEITSKAGERDLWEKAVKELELVIAEKDISMENLSKVNRKLSVDIELYETSLQDCKKNLRSTEDKLKQDTMDNKDQTWYKMILKEREEKIKELEETLKQMAKPEKTRDKRSLELTQGGKSVSETLELRKEKNELERKVEVLQEQLNQQVMETPRQELPENLDKINQLQLHETFPQDIKSSLNEFYLFMEKKLNEKMQMVTEFDDRLSRCVLKFKVLAEKVKCASPSQLQHVQETVFQEVSSLPELGDMNLAEQVPGDVNLEDVSPPHVNDENLSPQENLQDHEEQVSCLKEELQKERKINDEIIERFLELEESIKGYEDTIEVLRAEAGLVDNLRMQNENLVDEISKMKERGNDLEDVKVSLTAEQEAVDGIHEHGDSEQMKGTLKDMVTTAYDDQINSLRSIIESHENELKELREKAGEDDELIEELRANFQREEKWSREIQRKYEWELSSNACKDDRIEEIEECLWAREKAVKQLREQLEFEDKRCEELLEKLVASQKEAQELEDVVERLQRKLQDKEKRIIEFCDQNDRDAATIGNLSSENKQLRNEIENLTKTRKSLEEDVEELSGSLETSQQNGEKVVMRKDKDLEEISIQLKEEELTSKSKDEVIAKLQENAESLSENVKEMEFRMEEAKGILEEELRQTKDTLDQRKKDLIEASERYKELEEVCKSLKEKISQKEDQILEREAHIASQREVIESAEKQLEEFREIRGDTFTWLNNKPALIYTEEEMNEVNELLEQEKEISEELRTRVKLLENDMTSSKDSFLEMKGKFDTEKDTQRNALTTTREELYARNNLLEETRGELHAMSIELKRHEGALIAKEKEFEECKENLEILHSKLKKLDSEKQALKTIVTRSERNLTLEMNEKQTLIEGNEELKDEINHRVEQVKRVENLNTALREDLEKLTVKCLKSEKELKLAQQNNVNLKHCLEEYILQSQEQTRNLRHYEQEVDTLTEHIHEMNILVNDFRRALEAAIRNEKTNQDRSSENGVRTPRTNENTKETVLLLSSRDKTNVADQLIKQHPSSTLPSTSGFHGNEEINCDGQSAAHSPKPKVASQNKASPFSFKDSYQTLLTCSVFHNRTLFLVIGFLVFVFLFGCMSNSIVSRKYLFVFANSIISLTTFVLWRDEVRRNKQLKGLSPNQGLHERRTVKCQENGDLKNNSGDLFSECQRCGNGIMVDEEERLHFRNIKSSFQELHVKFLEAVENSSKDTLQIQELYKDYEKLKDEVEAMRKDRLNQNSIFTPHLEDENDSEKESLLPPKWNRVVFNLGRVFIIVFLCEILYIRGTFFSRLGSQMIFLFSCLAFSHLFDYFCTDYQNVEKNVRQTVSQLTQEIDELNEIIDKEHQLVMTQREAIKALEKRLRKEFERRIKERNVLLKKLKYKAKLEDLRELLDENHEGKKGYEGVNAKDKRNKESGCDQMVPTTTESDGMKNLQNILSKTTHASFTLDLAFSPMFFFLGIPLTGIMLSCRHLMLAALMTLTQITVFLKESKYIEVQSFPKVFQKKVHPIIMDTVVVLFACLLAVGLQCSQGIMVLITCAIVQLSVYWWSSYELAKREDIIYEISQKCLPRDGKESL